MEMHEIEYKVSVCIVTYNQEKYIRQCLQSIVDQKTNFHFEIVVGVDFSTDNTRSIVESFVEKYPNKVRAIFHEKNIGGVQNYFSVHDSAKGQYIAHVDGDDYILQDKLQRQSDFLDANYGCQIVWHRMKILNEFTNKIYVQQFDSNYIVDHRWFLDDVLANITIGLHSSKMYRRWDRTIKLATPSALDFSENVIQLYETGGYCAFVNSEALGVYRTGIGVSKNTKFIRVKLYEWFYFFYSKGVGNKNIIAAKVLLMVLSDLKYRIGSFGFGLLVLSRTIRSLIPFRVFECRSRMAPVTLAPSIDEAVESL